jgi:hypothetical protein
MRFFFRFDGSTAFRYAGAGANLSLHQTPTSMALVNFLLGSQPLALSQFTA